MNPEIENLINMALADGEVTEKERSIILRKAESLGLDQDEIEMILDGKITLLNKQSAYLENTKQPSQKEGDIKKCPSCGAQVQSFSTKCNDCGHEFRGIEATKSILTLLTQLREVEDHVKNKKRNLYTIIMDPTGMLLSPVRDVEIAKEKSKIILTFPVSNSKEDLIEILSTAVAQFHKGTSFSIRSLLYGNPNGIMKKAWRSKCEEVVLKARFSMKEDKASLAEIEHYAKQLGIK